MMIGKHTSLLLTALACATPWTAVSANAPPPIAPAPGSPSSTHPPQTQRPPSSTQAPAPGGGPGKVWVNTAAKVYHCPDDRLYGKTRRGEYMSEAEARSKGNHPDHNKPCV